MARFNIDLLIMLQDKTKGNLTDDEKKFLDAVVNDLQIKYLSVK
jgi:DNA replication initiation complex subunit (GINS family)